MPSRALASAALHAVPGAAMFTFGVLLSVGCPKALEESGCEDMTRLMTHGA